MRPQDRQMQYREHCDVCGDGAVSLSSFYSRISRGRDVQDAINTPANPRALSKLENAYKKHIELHKNNAVDYRAFCARVRRGSNVEDAIKKKSIKMLKGDELHNMRKQHKARFGDKAVKKAAFVYRVRNGRSAKEAIGTPNQRAR